MGGALSNGFLEGAFVFHVNSLYEHVHLFHLPDRTQNVEIAKAEGEKIKKIGAAEAYTIDAIGKAEAERMRMKANVYKSYGEAAIMSLVLEALPKVPEESVLLKSLTIAISADFF